MSSYFEDLTVYLLKRKPFYGYFLLESTKEFTDKIPTAGVSFDNKQKNVRFLFNESFLKQYSFAQAAAIVEHEIMHIIQKATRRMEAKAVSEQDRGLMNVAMDVAINQLIPEIPQTGVVNGKETEFATIENMRKKYPKLEYNLTSEQYFDIFKEMQEKNKGDAGEFSEIDDHTGLEGQGSGEAQEILKEVVEGIVKEKAKRAANKAGNLGGNEQLLLNELLKNKVNWKTQLHNFIQSSTDFTKIKTRKRRNRRYGIKFQGKKKDRKFHLMLAVDTSGSTQGLMNDFFAEINKIATFGHKITLVTCDTEIKEEIEYKKGKLPKISGGGGTLYNPVMERAREIKPDALIYFGDMDCYDEKNITNPKVPVLWAIIGESPQPTKFGRSIKIQ